MLVKGKALFLHSRMKTFSSEYVSLSGFLYQNLIKLPENISALLCFGRSYLKLILFLLINFV